MVIRTERTVAIRQNILECLINAFARLAGFNVNFILPAVHFHARLHQLVVLVPRRAALAHSAALVEVLGECTAYAAFPAQVWLILGAKAALVDVDLAVETHASVVL